MKIQQINLTIEGMGCSNCERTIGRALDELDGIADKKISYQTGNAEIKFDTEKLSVEKIVEKINSTHYHVTNVA